MNIFTAPLRLLSESFTDYDMDVDESARPSTSGKTPMYASGTLGTFLTMGTMMTLLVLGVGVYLILIDAPGDIEISGLGLTVKTQTGGIAMIALAMFFYLAIGKLVVDRFEG